MALFEYCASWSGALENRLHRFLQYVFLYFCTLIKSEPSFCVNIAKSLGFVSDKQFNRRLCSLIIIKKYLFHRRPAQTICCWCQMKRLEYFFGWLTLLPLVCLREEMREEFKISTVLGSQAMTCFKDKPEWQGNGNTSITIKVRPKTSHCTCRILSIRFLAYLLILLFSMTILLCE